MGSTPAALASLPASVRQAVRVTRSGAYCHQVYCAVLQAWQRGANGRWTAAQPAGAAGAERAQIGRKGFASPGAKREGDRRTPTGVYDIVTTFSTDARNPGTRMPWKRRLPTSNVGSAPGPSYNTWQEVAGANGDRSAMRYGVWIDYNHGRLAPGQGPAPLAGRGSGIFIHVNGSPTSHAATLACVAAAPAYVRWLLSWLDPAARPRVLLNV